MENIINFLHKIGELKKLKRTGWVLHKVPNPESVADHIFRVSIMAILFSGKLGFDKDKCVKMAVVHDLAEALSGDITPSDGISLKEKHEIEKKSMEQLTGKIEDTEIMKLWEEYEKMETPEAKFVYELDKLEMLIQAYEYEKEHGTNLQDFWNMHKDKIKNEELKKICEKLFESR